MATYSTLTNEQWAKVNEAVFPLITPELIATIAAMVQAGTDAIGTQLTPGQILSTLGREIPKRIPNPDKELNALLKGMDSATKRSMLELLKGGIPAPTEQNSADVARARVRVNHEAATVK